MTPELKAALVKLLEKLDEFVYVAEDVLHAPKTGRELRKAIEAVSDELDKEEE